MQLVELLAAGRLLSAAGRRQCRPSAPMQIVSIRVGRKCLSADELVLHAAVQYRAHEPIGGDGRLTSTVADRAPAPDLWWTQLRRRYLDVPSSFPDRPHIGWRRSGVGACGCPRVWGEHEGLECRRASEN